MAIFERYSDQDYEDDEEWQVEGKERKFDRKLKDLNSKNRRKRKEPPKPWGKKERLIVLIILASTVVIAGILAFINQESISPNFSIPSFNFDFSKLNPFKGETIEIRKK